MAAILVLNSKQRISLQNEHASRKLKIGGDWTRLRMGVLCYAGAPVQGDFNGASSLSLALCAGVQNVIGALNVDHAAQLASIRQPWIYYATEDRWETGWQFRVIESGTNNTLGTGALSGNGVTGFAQYLTAIFFECEKSAGNLILRAGMPSGTNLAGANQNITEQQLFDVLTHTSLQTGLSNFLTDYMHQEDTHSGFDEGTHGALDSVNVNTNYPGLQMHYERIAVVKHS